MFSVSPRCYSGSLQLRILFARTTSVSLYIIITVLLIYRAVPRFSVSIVIPKNEHLPFCVADSFDHKPVALIDVVSLTAKYDLNTFDRQWFSETIFMIYVYAKFCMACVAEGYKTSGGFIGSRAGSTPPPPLGDRLTPSLTVMLANATFWSFYCKTWYSECSKWLPPVAFWQL